MKIEILCEELVDGYQTVPYQPGALIWGDQLSGSGVSNPYFNPNNSPLIKLQISPPFTCTSPPPTP